jgi:hypothetical protein
VTQQVQVQSISIIREGSLTARIVCSKGTLSGIE